MIQSSTHKKVSSFSLAMVMLFSPFSMGQTNAASTMTKIAYDMYGSNNQNLISYSNAFAGAFSSGGDGFQKYQRFVSSSVPYSVMDDSLSIYTGDNLGIITEGNTDEFFGATDTINGNNSDAVSATWVFDVSGSTNLSLSLDIGAMGDFESSDYFVVEYQFDGGAVEAAFASTVDEAGSNTYTLEGGSNFTLNDPMLVDGTTLNNVLQTFTTELIGSGSQLTITLTASTNGGSEAFAFQNMVIGQEQTFEAYDMRGNSNQNLISYSNAFAGAFSSGGDGFQKYQRFVSSSVPYSVMDDSLSIYTGDNLGIITEGNTDEFFGATDTINGNNSDAVSATWVFDVSDTSDTLSLSINMGAMGDFESSDYFIWEYSFDGNTSETAFASTVDEAGSNIYTLEGGRTFTLNDPMLVDGEILTNELKTITTLLNGSGSELTITLTASTNGGSEAFAFQNIYITTGDDTPPPPPVSECGFEFTPIYTIQGSGLSSSSDGTLVSVEGIVTADMQEGKSGFTIQDPIGDDNATTSDGIFVHASSPDVNVGDMVRVTGSVDEYYNLTEITNVTDIEICSIGNTIEATAISLPLTQADALEAYEGMLVIFPQSLYISEYFNFGRYNEIVLSSERQFQPTATFDPGSTSAKGMLDSNLLSRIKLDDGRTSQNPDPALHPDGNIFDLANLFRGGDTLENLTGIIDYSYGEYKIQPTIGAEHISSNPRTMQPDYLGGNLTVSSFNVLNYFSTIDTGARICGPAEDSGCRGADTDEEFKRQRTKIFAALAAMDADIVGLIEIENNTAAIEDLVDGLNVLVGAGTYSYVDTGSIGDDAIKVAFIYKTETVSLKGEYAILDSSIDSRFIDTKNRPALAQSFMDKTNGGIFTAVVNHLKSKGSSCDDIGDPNLNDGAGNCNLTRTDAALALVDWIATDPTDSGDADFLIIGDLNAYDKEDPIDALLAGGYTDLINVYLGENAYSYVFDGQLGYLDHALANTSLVEEISAVTIWHINADEANLIDYDMNYKKDAQDALYAPDPYRSSDHDPVVIGINLCDEIAPTLDITLSKTMLWPANHKYVDVKTTVLANDNFDIVPTVKLLSVTSSEADNGLGDGDTANDIVIVDDNTFQLRAERSGKNGKGRTYAINYQVTDACGNNAVNTATVSVPFSKEK